MVWWRRWWPERDLGSFDGFSKGYGSCLCLWVRFRRGGEGGRTLRVELQNVDVAVCVRDGYVELFVRGEEGGCYYFECVGRFAEETELVGILLRSLF